MLFLETIHMTVTFSEYPIEKVIEGMLRQLCVILQGETAYNNKAGSSTISLRNGGNQYG